jgi:hypothetical protein
METETMEKPSVLERLKALDEERSRLLDDAKSEALEMAHNAIAALNELGFHYRLVEGPETPSRAATRASRGEEGPRRHQRDAVCPICHFKTDPVHDGRAHRSQATKKPFASEELMERGLSKVGD